MKRHSMKVGDEVWTLHGCGVITSVFKKENNSTLFYKVRCDDKSIVASEKDIVIKKLYIFDIEI